MSCQGGARVSLGLLLGCCKIFRSSWAMNLLPTERLDKSSGRQAGLNISPALAGVKEERLETWRKTPHLKNQKFYVGRKGYLSGTEDNRCSIQRNPRKEHGDGVDEWTLAVRARLSCLALLDSTLLHSFPPQTLDQRSQQICSFVGCDEHEPDGWGCCVHSVSARSLQKKNPSWLQCYATSIPLETRGWLTIRHHLLPTLHGTRKVWLLLTILEKNRRDSRIHRCRYGSIVPISIRYAHS